MIEFEGISKQQESALLEYIQALEFLVECRTQSQKHLAEYADNMRKRLSLRDRCETWFGDGSWERQLHGIVLPCKNTEGTMLAWAPWTEAIKYAQQRVDELKKKLQDAHGSTLTT